MRSLKSSVCAAILAFSSLLLSAGLHAQEVINEDFEGLGPPAGLTIVPGSSQVLDDGCGNQVLSLTQGLNNQSGFAWFDGQFDLNARRVECEFDLFLGMGTVVPPADGLSVIFQFAGDVNATGGLGGGLGVENFRGDQSPYIAVSFDIWDNGDGDIETGCDTRGAGNAASCAVEVNQNILVPYLGSNAQAAGPDFIGSAGVYHTPAGAGSCDGADLIHVKIIFDSGLMNVTMSGPRAQNGVDPFPEQTVISYAVAPFPEDLSNLGFAASTGGSNAHQWVDNVIIRELEPKVTFTAEPALSAGGLNSGGPAVDATAEINVNFRQENTFGGELSRVGSIDTSLTITTSRFGRVSTGADFVNTNPRPINVARVPGAGAETAKVFGDDAWSTIGVRYRAEVEPGRYDVALYWAENYPLAIDGLRRGTKLYDVSLNGTKVLCNWSAAAAAGSPTGSGSPYVACVGTLDTGVRRTFSVSIPDAGGGFGVLDILVDDLGGGNPPENAALQALSLRRTGNAGGGTVTGELECITRAPSPAPPGTLIDEGFDGTANGQCPDGMDCTGVLYVPQAVDGRLRLADDLVFGSGSTAIFHQTVNVADASLRAEFDVFMGNADGAGDPAALGFEAADGGAFFVMQGNDTTALGFAGGGIGIPYNAYGFAVEFDTWLGGGNNEPSGFNAPAVAFTHVGINNLSTDSAKTNVEQDPSLVPVAAGGAGWPDFFHPDGVHVVISYNSGHVEVTLTGTTAEDAPFGPALVVEADVPPIAASEAVAGFSGGTGGRTQDLDFDNVSIDAAPGAPPTSDPLEAALDRARARWRDQRELYINAGGPVLACDAVQFPAPQATGDPGPGEEVVWVSDLGVGAAPVEGEFFSVTPLLDQIGNPAVLGAAFTDMGLWDARGTSAGLDDADTLFHYERYGAVQYDIPVAPDTYEVTLYFANSFTGTAGTARRVFHVEVEFSEKDGFEHCAASGKLANGNPINNRYATRGNLFDPVDAAEKLYAGANACNFPTCPANGAVSLADLDRDGILGTDECGNAAAVALRYEVVVTDSILSIAFTPPRTAELEPASPDGNPKVSGIVVKKKQTVGGGNFRRGDGDGIFPINISDPIFVLNNLFSGGAPPPCPDAADGDDSGALNITDPIRVLNFLFSGGPAPPAPGNVNCGADPTADGLGPCEYTCP